MEEFSADQGNNYNDEGAAHPVHWTFDWLGGQEVDCCPSWMGLVTEVDPSCKLGHPHRVLHASKRHGGQMTTRRSANWSAQHKLPLA